MKQKTLTVCILLFLSQVIFPQSATENIESIINDIFEQYTAESGETIDYESFYNDLISLSENPVNLNNATREELEKMAFLSDSQIENILAYVYKNQKMNSIYELQLIDGLDMTDIRRMLSFVNIGEFTEQTDKFFANEIFKYGKSDMFMRFDKGIEQKKGYIKTSENQTPYFGSSIYNSLKYNFNFRNRIQFGTSMEKDAGEQFWGKQHKGYDFYSFYLQANNIGKLKTIVAGNFRASFGQGLVFNSGFGSSKSAYTVQVVSRENGLKKFSSTDETNFLKGFGGTILIGKTEISMFYSNKKTDADTLNGKFKSFYRTGLHRTESEYSKKHTVGMQTLGIHTTTNLNIARIGFTAAHTILRDTLQPDPEPYNRFYFSGKRQTTLAVDYRLRLSTFNFFGESAITNNHGTATINGILFSPASTISIVSLWRYYSVGYDTFYANAFSESTRTNNETGIYTGIEVRPFSKWKFSAYADSYRFPWLKYGVNAPSTGQDYLLQTEYAPGRNVFMNWRIRYEQKQKNTGENIIVRVQNYAKSSIRYQLMCNFGDFSTKNLVEISFNDSSGLNPKAGFAAYQDLSYNFRKIPLTIDLRCMLFDAPDYENRFYLYEKDILYAFSIPASYGLGMRFYLNLKYQPAKQYTFWLKLAQTMYGDGRTSVGSGNEEIAGNKKTDVRFLIRYQF